MNSSQKTIQLDIEDDVAVARGQMMSGMALGIGDVMAKGLVPAGHKIALRDISIGQCVRKYRQVIGVATKNISAGEHVHSHNLSVEGYLGVSSQEKRTGKRFSMQVSDGATFKGFERADGTAGTRNWIGILTTVNCSATVAKAIADCFRKDLFPQSLAAFPNIDGVVALTHSMGCGMDAGENLTVLQRTLIGYAHHPNFAAVLVVGLGCEVNQLLSDETRSLLGPQSRVKGITIQGAGGTRHAVEKGCTLIRDLLADCNRVRRTDVSASKLMVGLQCGGSDGYSGISANPALGYAVDLLIAEGGTALLSETPEIYGAEHLLTSRAINSAVTESLLEKLTWWQAYAKRNGAELDNNPSPGNKAGGLTTILEKSLGAVAKGGSSPLVEVVGYAQVPSSRGLVFMDTPGYDPVSATGQVAGGANLICFTTGRGSAYGCAPTPSIKLSTNSALWDRQQEDLDLNCGTIIDGTQSVEEVGRSIYAMMLAVASGQLTKSEVHGYGQNEFVPWQLGAVL